MMIYSPTLFTSLLAGFALMATFHPVVLVNGQTAATDLIKIITSPAPIFTFSADADSTIAVSYNLQGGSIPTDFEVLHFLSADCNTGGTYAYLTLNGASPATTNSTSTTSTLSPVAGMTMPQGDSSFCLKVELRLKLTDGSTKSWQTVGFKFTVTTTYSNGVAEKSFGISEGEVVGETVSESVAETENASGKAPTIDLKLVGAATSFKFGETINVDVTASHPLDVFDYSTTLNDFTWKYGGAQTAITPRTKEYNAKPSFVRVGNEGVVGTVSFSLPLVVYQNAGETSILIAAKVAYTVKSQTRRMLQTATDDYTGPSSGDVDAALLIELEPYTDESGAIVGFTVTGIISSSVCFVGAASLFI